MPNHHPAIAPPSGLAARVAGLALAVGLAACQGIAPPPAGRADPATLSALDRFNSNSCNPAVASVLAGTGVPAQQIRGLTYGIYRSVTGDQITGWDAWVGLTDQPGAIVVSMDGDCRPRQIYAREGARLPTGSR